jgi:hypothetical protein
MVVLLKFGDKWVVSIAIHELTARWNHQGDDDFVENIWQMGGFYCYTQLTTRWNHQGDDDFVENRWQMSGMIAYIPIVITTYKFDCDKNLITNNSLRTNS